MMEEFRRIFVEALAKAEIQLTAKQIDQFTKYFELLVETNKVMNLTALTEPKDVAVKHFVDCLLAYNAKMAGSTVADVGTGAGFPGVVWKIYDPSIRLTLIDSLNKRLKFLETVVANLGLDNVQLVHTRAEDAGRDDKLREHFQFVTARAVARLNVLAELCLPLVQVGGTFIALKGVMQEELAEAESAIAVLGGKVQETKKVTLPFFEDEQRNVVVVEKIKKTSGKYPRKAGVVKKEPL